MLRTGPWAVTLVVALSAVLSACDDTTSTPDGGLSPDGSLPQVDGSLPHPDSGLIESDEDAAVAPTDGGQTGGPLDGAVAPDAGGSSDGGPTPAMDGSVGSDDGGQSPDSGTSVLIDSGSSVLDAATPGDDGSTPDAGSAGGLTLPLDLGHTSSILRLRQAHDRVLSQETTGRWVLWDVTTREPLASGDSPFPSADYPDTVWVPNAELAGATLAILGATQIELRSTTDGSLLASIARNNTRDTQFGLASDGSYVWAADSSGVSAWSLGGAQLLNNVGGYRTAQLAATPGALHVAMGPAGATTIEHFAVSDGARTTTTIASGTFNKWFVDGEHFFTNTNNTVWVFTPAGVQVGIFALPTVENLTGQGSHFWTYRDHTVGYPLDIYSVTGGSTAVANHALGALVKAIPSGPSTLGILAYGGGSVDIVDLDAPTVRTTHAIPVLAYLETFASDGESFVVGNRSGVVVDSQNLTVAGGPHSLSRGLARSVGGSASGWAAAAFADGSIAIIDATGSTPALTGQVSFSSSSVQLAGSGDFMIAQANADDAQYNTDRSFKQFALPGGALLKTWPYQYSERPLPHSFVLPASASVWARIFYGESTGPTTTYLRQVSNVDTDALVWSDTIMLNDSPPPIRISRDGTRIAVSDGIAYAGVSTQLFVDGSLTGAVQGWAVGWVDDTHLLVNRYVSVGHGSSAFDHTELVDAQGTVTASSFPKLDNIFAISATEAYAPDVNVIYDSDTATQLWSGSSPLRHNGVEPVGGVASDFVIYATGHELVSESWR